MPERKLERSLPVSDQLQEILRERIRDGGYPEGAKFPSESDLVEEFGVSRITVRRACTKLVAEGLLIRRWGVGTFVSKIAQIMNPINRIISFSDLIKNAGYKPDVFIESAEVISADPILAEKLSVEEGSRLLRLVKTFTADGHTAILTTTSYPEWVLGDCFDQVLADPVITEPLLSFLNTSCGQRIKNMITVFWPDTARGCGLSRKGLDPMTPVLVMNHTAYNFDEVPILATSQIQLGNMMKFTLIRQSDESSQAF